MPTRRDMQAAVVAMLLGGWAGPAAAADLDRGPTGGQDTHATVPSADWSPGWFAGDAGDDWLLGNPLRLTPRPRATAVHRYPQGPPLEGDFPGRRLLLSFDDGPKPATTTRLLDILRREHVHAAFFVSAWRLATLPDCAAARRLVVRMAADGHAVGSHGYEHPHMNRMSDAKRLRQLVRAHQALLPLLGYAPTLFRPPYGLTTPELDRLLAFHGYTRVHWSYVGGEFNGRAAPYRVRTILRQMREREAEGRYPGGIVLLHDTHARTVDAVELLIRRLRAENCALLDAGDDDLWRFVEVSELLDPAGSPPGTGSVPAPPAVLAEARTWCAAHAAELPELYLLDGT
ncbi:MAG: polysaccharide deacetylase family protein [Deltaproteobacteria bacterium]|nr:polysaccharide deacetylase family protein [Deltaproteobacteria bacterium]